MEYRSNRQKQWANSPEGIDALGRDKVDAANKSSPGNLPEKVLKPHKPKKLQTPEKKMNFNHFRPIKWA